MGGHRNECGEGLVEEGVKGVGVKEGSGGGQREGRGGELRWDWDRGREGMCREDWAGSGRGLCGTGCSIGGEEGVFDGAGPPEWLRYGKKGVRRA